MKITATKKYEVLAENVRKFITALKNRKSIVAFFYNASEQPKPLTPNAPPQQFNVLEVRALMSFVQTADRLGHQTLLTADGDKLYIHFIEKYPYIPRELEVL